MAILINIYHQLLKLFGRCKCSEKSPCDDVADDCVKSDADINIRVKRIKINNK